MNILAWIIFGALAGWIASLLMNTNGQQGAFTNISIGILGAILGGFIMSLKGGKSITGFNIYSLIVATSGAILLITLLHPHKKG